ncbi:MAG: hypothetical protein JW384_01258 [Nitrosomonadaceae bacterium]|nr:hypothetical protein [Nitrosomonadaceae bacterium]
MTLAPSSELIINPLLTDMRTIERGHRKGIPLTIVAPEYIVEISGATTGATHQQSPRWLAPFHRLEDPVRYRLRLIHNIHQIIARTLHMPAFRLLRIARAEPYASTHQLLTIHLLRVHIPDLSILDREPILLATQSIDHLPQVRPQSIGHLSVHTSRTYHKATRPANHVPDNRARGYHARFSRSIRGFECYLGMLLVQRSQHLLLPRVGVAKPQHHLGEVGQMLCLLQELTLLPCRDMRTHSQ